MLHEFCISNFLRSSKQYFIWLMKFHFLACLICNPKKYVSSRSRDISSSPCIKLANSWQRDLLVEPTIISSTYTWAKRICFNLRLINKVVFTLPRLNPCLIKNQLWRSYQTLGAYLRPYMALLSLKT